MSAHTIKYPSLDTPAILIDLDKLDSNIKEMTKAAKDANIKLRPHVKIHQCPDIAKMQIEAGACGIEVGTVAQAQVMAEAGINDIVIAHPFCGEQKLNKLKTLLQKDKLKLSIVVDMIEQAQALSGIGKALNVTIPVLIKIDTGINRYGVKPGKPALELASTLIKIPHIELIGIYAHESGAVPTQEGVDKMAFEVASLTSDAASFIRKEGISIKEVCVGASSTLHSTCRYIKENKFPDITEVHPGACVIGDITYMMGRAITRDACALSVLTSVMSTSHDDHVVIDAGFKTFGADSIIGRRDNPEFFWERMASFGSIQGRTDLWLGKLGAESGWLYYKHGDRKLTLGERLEIVPNNTTEVLNIHDRAYGVRNGTIEREFIIAGRGKGS